MTTQLIAHMKNKVRSSNFMPNTTGQSDLQLLKNNVTGYHNGYPSTK